MHKTKFSKDVQKKEKNTYIYYPVKPEARQCSGEGTPEEVHDDLTIQERKAEMKKRREKRREKQKKVNSSGFN